MKAGDEKDINITFPENYAPELAGAAVVFKVKAHEIKERKLPALDDEFAKDVSEFETLDELKKDLSAKVKERRQEQVERDFENDILTALIDKLECEVPDAMIEYRAGRLIEDMANRLQGSGMTLEQYVGMMGMDMDTLRAQAKMSAEREVRSGLALDAVAAAEKIEIADKEVEDELQKMADEYKIDIEKVRANVDTEDIKKNLAAQKALELVKKASKRPKKAAKKEESTEKSEKTEE